MAYFQKNPVLGKFWTVLQLKISVILYGHLVQFTDICYSLWPFDILYDYLVYFSRFGMLFQETSSNPDANQRKVCRDQCYKKQLEKGTP
jgi:hypothetical protein